MPIHYHFHANFTKIGVPMKMQWIFTVKLKISKIWTADLFISSLRVFLQNFSLPRHLSPKFSLGHGDRWKSGVSELKSEDFLCVLSDFPLLELAKSLNFRKSSDRACPSENFFRKCRRGLKIGMHHPHILSYRFAVQIFEILSFTLKIHCIFIGIPILVKFAWKW